MSGKSKDEPKPEMVESWAAYLDARLGEIVKVEFAK